MLNILLTLICCILTGIPSTATCSERRAPEQQLMKEKNTTGYCPSEETCKTTCAICGACCLAGMTVSLSGCLTAAFCPQCCGAATPCIGAVALPACIYCNHK